MPVRIRDMTITDAPSCAAFACASEIGRRYGFTKEGLAQTFTDAISRREQLFVAEEQGRVIGFAWIDPRGAFSTAPYLRLIVVDESHRAGGVGSALLAEFETRTVSVGRDYCLLVSDFNTAAQAFYEKHGYKRAGALPDFARAGITEVLMVKKRGPAQP